MLIVIGLFLAKIYAYLNDRLYVELYPIREVSHELDSVSSNALEIYDDSAARENYSLNELLVHKKFAEFKIESDVCQQMNFRRDMNNYHETVSREDVLKEEFALNFDTDVLSPAEFQFDVSLLEVVYMVQHFLFLNLGESIGRDLGPTIHAQSHSNSWASVSA